MLFTSHTFTSQTQVTRFLQLSNSTAATANVFAYTVRDVNNPHNQLFTGVATRTNRTVYTNVTQGGNNTNLDEFSIASLTLDPGTYYIGIHSTDGNAYQSIATTGGNPEKLLAENGGAPFLSGTDFHLYTILYGIIANSADTTAFNAQRVVAFNSIPVNTFIMNSLSLSSLAQVDLRLSQIKSLGYVPQTSGEGDWGLRVWTLGNFTSLHRDSTGDSSGYDSDTTTGHIVADYALNEFFTLGFSYGVSRAEIDLLNNQGEIDVEGDHFSLYLNYLNGGFYTNFVYSYEDFKMDVRRNAGSFGTAKSSPDAHAHTFQLAAGYEFSFDNILTGPVAKISYSDTTVDRYNKANAGLGNLRVNETGARNITTSLGWTLRYQGDSFSPYLNLYYEHEEFESDDTNIASIANPSLTSSQSVDSDKDDYGRLEIGFDYLISDQAMLSLGYATQLFHQGVEYHSFSLAFEYNF